VIGSRELLGSRQLVYWWAGADVRPWPRSRAGRRRSDRVADLLVIAHASPMTRWDAWIARAWSLLRDGHTLRVPSELPHPSTAGFERAAFAEPAGQTQDWVVSMSDRSRLHVHVMGNGTKFIHRDATDPSISPAHAVWHVATETRTGPIVIGAAILGTILWASSRAGRSPRSRSAGLL
jgi:hypothetical protein